MLVEVVVGPLVHSFALRSDAARILTDLAAFVCAASADVVNLTRGFKRAGRIASLVSTIMLNSAHALLKPSGVSHSRTGLRDVWVGFLGTSATVPRPWPRLRH